MKKQKVFPYFFLSLFLLAMQSQLSISIRIFPFAPFLSIAYSRLPKAQFLWASVTIGWILDLFSHTFPFGFHMISLVSIALLLQYKRLSFIDRPLGLCLLTFLFSFLLTSALRLLLFFTSHSFYFTLYGILSDFIFLPILDAICAFLFFYLSQSLYSRVKKEWKYFLLFLKTRTSKKKKQSSQQLHR